MKTRRPFSPFLAAIVLLVAACGTASAPSAPPGTGLSIIAAAGPTCPVERIPPDPACASRPVAGASIVIKDGQGKTVATVVTDAIGSVAVALPAGAYVVEPQPAAGLMGTAASQDVAVADGAMTPVLLAYDTGIR